MNIALSCDNNYCQHTSVTIVSTCINNNDVLHFYILTNFIDKENQSEFDRLANKFNCKIDVVLIDDNIIKKFPIGKGTANDYVNFATYYRLLLPDVLPNIDRVLYLDSDIVVNGSLSELWNWTFSGENFIAALEDERCSSSRGAARLGYEVSFSYFNAGVLLLNLKEMRLHFSFNNVVNYVNGHRDSIMFHDQDILNGLFHSKKEYFPLKFNVMNPFLKKNAVLPERYRSQRNALQHPVVIHFSSPIKPWHKECRNPYNFLYYKYLVYTKWKDYKPKFKNVTIKDKLHYKLEILARVILEFLHLKYSSYIKI